MLFLATLPPYVRPRQPLGTFHGILLLARHLADPLFGKFSILTHSIPHGPELGFPWPLAEFK